MVWKLDLSDPCHRWIVYGYYEGGDGIRYARQQLKDGGVYVDSGANIGQWLLYLAGQKSIKTLAFEPVSTQRHWLNDCLIRQDQWNVQLDKSALSYKSGTLEIQVDGARSTVQMDWFTDKNLELEEITTERLDLLITNYGVTEISFWKLDVEGAELAALQGASRLLDEGRIGTIYFECHPDNYTAVCDLFATSGYTVFQLQKHRLVPFTRSSIAATTDLVASKIQP